MNNIIKYILSLFFVFFISLIKTDNCATVIKNSSSHEFSFSSNKDHPKTFFILNPQHTSFQSTNISKNRNFPFRLVPVTKYIFRNDYFSLNNISIRNKTVRNKTKFIFAEKRNSGYYIYSLRKIII
jgi:hypothetical protein